MQKHQCIDDTIRLATNVAMPLQLFKFGDYVISMNRKDPLCHPALLKDG